MKEPYLEVTFLKGRALAAGSNSSLTRPPITIENNTGELVFSYVFTDPFGNQIGRVNSAAFRVEPPA